ncbi:MAG: hemolysin D [Lysobacteraceae bacterium]|nr:MAG: hemolysin D [Xanthomonadaceae bacterium]
MARNKTCTGIEMMDLKSRIVWLALLLTPLAWAQPGGPRPVQVMTAESQLMTMAPHARVAATVISRNDIRLAAEVSGRLTTSLEAGSEVDQGDIIAAVDDKPLRLRLRETEALLARAEAQLQYLTSEQDRLQKLSAQNSAARSQLEQTVADRASAAADKAAQQARIAQLQDEIDRSRIRAPFHGVVAQRYVQTGERVAVGDEVARMLDPDSLEAIARVPLEYINFSKAGDEITLTDGKRRESAVVRASIAVGDQDTHLFELRIKVPPNTWPAGQTLRAEVPTDRYREVLAVPRDALVLRGDGIYVFVVNEDQTARRIMVETGVADGDWIEVMGDLSPGMTVITRGNERLREGQTVSAGGPPAAE